MSDLARSAMSARLAKLPHLPPIANSEQEEDGDEVADLRAMPPPPAPRATRARRSPNPKLAPVSAEGFFAQAIQVNVAESHLDVRAYYTTPAEGGTLVVCHHGAGYSGLTFAHMAPHIVALSKGLCGVLAFDVRGHGKTTPTDTEINEYDLSLGRLSEDFVALLKTLYTEPAKAPSFLLVGHSMGGAVVVRACATLLAAKYRIVGAAVLDVVEGSALDALPHMFALLDSRPRSFLSAEEAIEWHLATHAVRNSESARVSVPAILRKPTAEEGEWTWRTPLQKTSPFWREWFTGLSQAFLATRAARLLILAGTDRLDKDLMIGQLQGKFQLVIVPEVGHLVQEDDPPRIAEILVEFWRRNDRVIPGVKKVGDL